MTHLRIMREVCWTCRFIAYHKGNFGVVWRDFQADWRQRLRTEHSRLLQIISWHTALFFHLTRKNKTRGVERLLLNNMLMDNDWIKFMVHCLSGTVCGFLRGQTTPCCHALCCFYLTRLLKSEIVLRHLVSATLHHTVTVWNATPRCHTTKTLYFSKIISKSSILNFVSKLIFYFHACDQNRLCI